MPAFPSCGRRVAGTLTTPGGTGCTAGGDASCSTIPTAARCHLHRLRYDKEETDE
jgi:hypothetical protein